jgi:hypothetical protein
MSTAPASAEERKRNRSQHEGLAQLPSFGCPRAWEGGWVAVPFQVLNNSRQYESALEEVESRHISLTQYKPD